MKQSSWLLICYFVAAFVNASFKETMTLCLNCTNTDLCAGDSDPKVFDVPVGKCFNPQVIFPDSGEVWGKFDVLDDCGDYTMTRKFFATTNGTCGGNATDTYRLRYDRCLGPFGAPRPWGVFECEQNQSSILSG